MRQERETHFKHFAELLWEEIDPLIDELCYERCGDYDNPYVQRAIQDIQKRIAQRTYDLVDYIASEHCKYLDTWAKDAGCEWDVDATPDIAQWPPRITT